MSLLSIVQDACYRAKQTAPTSVIGSTDQTARLMLSLANQDGVSLAKRHDWQRMTMEKTFTATATAEQTGALPTDFGRTIPKTFWNRTQDRMVIGPLSPQRWQQLQTGILVMSNDAFRIRGNSLLMNPVPQAGDSMAYEYVSTYWCGGAASTVPTQAAWVADSDVTYIDEELQTLGLVFRFKRSAGLEYGEAQMDYEMYLAAIKGTDGGIADLNMGDTYDGTLYDPYVPDGNWSIN